jgi:hypothetical protein
MPSWSRPDAKKQAPPSNRFAEDYITGFIQSQEKVVIINATMRKWFMREGRVSISVVILRGTMLQLGTGWPGRLIQSPFSARTEFLSGPIGCPLQFSLFERSLFTLHNETFRRRHEAATLALQGVRDTRSSITNGSHQQT